MTGQRRAPGRWRGLLRWRQTWLSNDLLVRAPQHRKRAALVIVVLALAGWGLLVVITTAPYGAWYRGVASGALGSFIGAACLSFWRKQHAYRAGWLDGRRAMQRALREARYRRISPWEALDLERERDAVLIGLNQRSEHEQQVRAGGGNGTGWRGWGVRAAGRLRVHLAGRQRSAGDPSTPSRERSAGDDRQAS